MSIVATNKSATSAIAIGAGRLEGIVVASSNSGTLKVMDSLDGTNGNVIINTTSAITAPVFWPVKGDFQTGLYVTRAGTAADYTILWSRGERMGRSMVAAGNKSATGLIVEGAGRLKGIFVASSSSGTLKAWDNTAASGTVIFNTTGTLPIGWFECPADFINGLFITTGGTINFTAVYER